MKLVTADQMRRIDRLAIEKHGIPGIVLMENAGRQVAEAVWEVLQERYRGPVLIVCGKGNNGGDGLVAARHLLNRGVEVQVALLAPGGELSGDAATNYRIARNIGVPLVEHADGEAVRVTARRAGVLVDAILGTGISGDVQGVPAEAIDALNRSSAPVVAVDIPSGIHADTGAVCGLAVRADVTVTFGLPKIGLLLHPGAEHCGQLRVADISLPRHLLESPGLQANLVNGGMAADMLPARHPAMHKGDAGRVLVVAGSVGMTGAAALCAQAAVRAGAGLVFVACPASLNDILEAKCTEAMTLPLPLPETDERTLGAAARETILAEARRSDAVALGPGLSQHPETAALVREVVAACSAALVLDADGLNALEGEAGLVKERRAATVITPHPGELARLMGGTVENIQQDRVDAARRAAEATGAVVVLKGAATVTAAPGGEVWVNSTGNPGMASGGMGDVLTGMVAAFLAGGAEATGAAVAGVYYHGLAADMAAEEGGMRGLAATDVVGAVRKALPD